MPEHLSHVPQWVWGFRWLQSLAIVFGAVKVPEKTEEQVLDFTLAEIRREQNQLRRERLHAQIALDDLQVRCEAAESRAQRVIAMLQERKGLTTREITE